ncbi:GGDEF domain-containing protein [Pseudomonas sessilinigenes]|uniref:diguanylate cyclase n=1 Tax=Pseudomonas sessilinigenes TaxID=658629 RepID=A0ABX8MKK5_9PSED|nr:sensor domain-containing diguanylate cyclase [Pseudomonas sessilinigenes]AZC26223.1 GGDEF domain protein [Pseudomonas sessilinigenes]QXH39756.1 sensor domain-containing diguanylate cyclase [Pseudomonas sessilinigenes]
MSLSSATSRTGTPASNSERLLILASSLIVAAILGIVTFLLIRERASAEQAAIRAANNIVQLIDADVMRNVELYDQSLKGLISAAQRSDLDHVSAAIRHLALFDRASAAPYKGDILLLDKHGDVLADSASVQPRKANFADREYFRLHAANPAPGMMISRPFRARTTEQDWRISFSRRLNGENGEFQGVAEAAMRLSYFNQLFKNLDIGRNGTINLISREGILLAQQPQLADDLVGKDFSQRPNFVRFLREGYGSFSSISSVDQMPRLYTFSKVGDLPLIVIVALATDEVFGSWRRTALLVSGATGALCIALLWLTLLLCRELRRRHNAEQELARLASIDALTGLANRRTLDLALKNEWARAQRSLQPLSLLMIDVDHFKNFNDRFGHPMGDQALHLVAQTIAACIGRPTDLAARYGGEEFAVVLPGTDTVGASLLAEKIRTSIQDLPAISEQAASLTVSIGINTWSGNPGASQQEWLNNADKALYQAKSSGRNRVVSNMSQGCSRRSA